MEDSDSRFSILNRVLKNPVSRLVKKVPDARRARNRSFGSLRTGSAEAYFKEYVGATPLGA